MTDWQAVRDWLAETVMAWTLSEDYDEFFPCDEPIWFKDATTRNHAICPRSHWQPDSDWAQCGRVIEAMDRAGFCFYVGSMRTDSPYARFKANSGFVEPDRQGSANADTFCQAVCLAAAYATGYEEGER